LGVGKRGRGGLPPRIRKTARSGQKSRKGVSNVAVSHFYVGLLKPKSKGERTKARPGLFLPLNQLCREFRVGLKRRQCRPDQDNPSNPDSRGGCSIGEGKKTWSDLSHRMATAANSFVGQGKGKNADGTTPGAGSVTNQGASQQFSIKEGRKEDH